VVMEFWFTELHTPNFNIRVRVKETLEVRRTTYQDLAVLDTFDFGRMLVLDGIIQTTEADEFIYHEMIAHGFWSSAAGTAASSGKCFVTGQCGRWTMWRLTRP
jgi:spermidine synthase